MKISFLLVFAALLQLLSSRSVEARLGQALDGLESPDDSLDGFESPDSPNDLNLLFIDQHLKGHENLRQLLLDSVLQGHIPIEAINKAIADDDAAVPTFDDVDETSTVDSNAPEMSNNISDIPFDHTFHERQLSIVSHEPVVHDHSRRLSTPYDCECDVEGARGIPFPAETTSHQFRDAISNYIDSSGRSPFGNKIGCWDVSRVTSMDGAFYKQATFNEPLCWDVSQVTNMASMFSDAQQFSGRGLEDWDVSKVIVILEMFQDASSFNQDISRWNTTSVKLMNNMFSGAKGFNQDISKWNTANVQQMWQMFYEAKVFNQDLSGWDVGKVETMKSMFSKAKAFDQDLCEWKSNTNICYNDGTANMFEGTLCMDTSSPLLGDPDSNWCGGCSGPLSNVERTFIGKNSAKFVKTGGDSNQYDASYKRFEPVFSKFCHAEITFSPGDNTSTHRRLTLSTNPVDTSVTGTNWIGFFPNGVMKISGRGDRKYSAGDVFSLEMDGIQKPYKRLVLRVLEEKQGVNPQTHRGVLQTFDLPDDPLYANLLFHEIGASMEASFIPCNNGKEENLQSALTSKGLKFVKNDGNNDQYDAYYQNSQPIFSTDYGNGRVKFSAAGDANTHRRLVLSTDPENTSIIGNFYVGLFPNGRLTIKDKPDETYSKDDWFFLSVSQSKIVLERKGTSTPLATFDLPDDPLYASLFFNEKGAVMEASFVEPQPLIAL